LGKRGYEAVRELGGGFGMLEKDGVLRIDGAGLGEEGVGSGGLSEETCLAGLLDEFGYVVLLNDLECTSVVGVIGIEVDGVGNASFGSGKIVAVEEACTLKVGVFGCLNLTPGGRRRSLFSRLR